MVSNTLTSEVIQQKISSITASFNKISDLIKERVDSIEKLRKEIAELQDEQKRLQGEYRFVVNLAKEHGFLTDEGVEAIGESKVEEKG